MAEITAALVKELREKTGAGMMDCKKALAESGGALEAAVDWLRKKGLAQAAKKAGRVASEGLVGVAVKGNAGAVVEINAETDFVARNSTFQAFVAEVAELAATTGGDLDKILAAKLKSGRTVQDEITHLVATIGENISLRRADALKVGQGVVASYIHNQTTAGLGRIGVLVALESPGEAGKLLPLGKQIAMHVAAANPQALDVAGLDPAAVEREKTVLADQARASGKPEEIVQKMLEGRLRKFYQEVVLLEQDFVVEPGTSVAKIVQGASKTLGAPLKIAGFVRFAIGEGIEKKQSDFAAEVAELVR
ncbi:MAG TPA: translation elongation factor Ts [Alphaproteobacteria bacterium]|nr:translation elongation factor Ts [Alphaproteobacteria bacterium]